MNVVCETKNVGANGTSMIGYLNLSYDEIVSVFGKPRRFTEDKIEWEWVFKLNDTVLTIYNWKDGPGYTGNKKIKARDITKWHVGGKYHYDLKILEFYIYQQMGEKFHLGEDLIQEDII